MTTAEKKTARWRVWQTTRLARPNTSEREGDLVTAVQAEIWHCRYPPVSAIQALSTECGHPVHAADMRMFTGLDITLRARGWSFIGECSGPEVLTFSYGPAAADFDYASQGREPVTTVVVVLDRSLVTGTVADCEVEILLAGAPHGQAHLTRLSSLTKHLAVIEAHRPADPPPICFPVGRARAAQRVGRAAAAAAHV
ncbi:hypothetical protein ACLMAL_28705 [Nocardia sp. CWNU-33]|uniref:hypothetical protein n=1 Tax=Nocardia sp. CWNU-33 TaxID=3392117 RepID=UPI00398EB5A3